MRPAPPLAGALSAILLLSGCGQKPATETAAVPAAPAPTADASAPAVEPVTPLDYSKPEAWLCRPDADGACKQDATATSISADGKLTKDRLVVDPNAPIDCFYVYPTVSRDETSNSDAIAGPEESEVIRQQFVRFGSACRLYAPVYRQVTLPALRALLRGEKPATNREMAYADVKAAWEYYYNNYNGGRGVIIIGHSQGAGVLTRLIAAEIDGKPAQEKLVSAILAGTNLAIGPDGAFNNIPPCSSAASLQCAIAWVSFRADAPPPENSLFGKADQARQHVACVNPAELDGSGGQLKAMLPVAPVLFDAMSAPAPWTIDAKPIDTPFVMLPGMLSAECVTRGPFSYLAVTLNADPADKRTDTIAGDVVVDGKVQAAWGLHLIDMNLVMGNLVEIAKRQGAEWKRLHPPDASKPGTAKPGSSQPN